MMRGKNGVLMAENGEKKQWMKIIKSGRKGKEDIQNSLPGGRGEKLTRRKQGKPYGLPIIKSNSDNLSYKKVEGERHCGKGKEMCCWLYERGRGDDFISKTRNEGEDDKLAWIKRFSFMIQMKGKDERLR